MCVSMSLSVTPGAAKVDDEAPPPLPSRHSFVNGIGTWRELHVHVLMRDEKEERSKQGQTNNKAKQHGTPKAVTFPKKNELPQVDMYML